MVVSLLIPASAVVAGALAGVGILFLIKKRPSEKIDPSSLGTTFVFSGSIKQTSVLDAIQLLEIGRRQGVLHVYCGRRKGYLIFLDGKVVDAFWRNQTGREGVLCMLDLKEGDFYFEPRKIVQPRLISESILGFAFELEARKQ